MKINSCPCCNYRFVMRDGRKCPRCGSWLCLPGEYYPMPDERTRVFVYEGPKGPWLRHAIYWKEIKI